MKITVSHEVPQADRANWMSEFNGRKQTERTRCGIANSEITQNAGNLIEVTHTVPEKNANKATKHINDFDKAGERTKSHVKD
jgi:hypothetical protein